MGRGVPSVDLADQLDVNLPNGESYRLRPGPYGRGIAVIPLGSESALVTQPKQGRGRRPRPGTLALRDRLARDHDEGEISDARHYVQWLMRIDPTISISVARQVVYRERRRFV